MNPIVIYTILLVSYYILRCVFPDYFIGGNIYANNSNNIFPQTAMGLANITAYWIVFSNIRFMKSYPNMLFLFRLVILYAVYALGWMAIEGFSVAASVDLMKSTSSIFLFFVFYLSYQKNPRITWRCLKIIVPLSVLHYIYLFNVQIAFAHKMGIDGDIDSNYGAAIAASLVYPLCIRNSKWAFYIYMAMMLFVLYCGQRSGILIAFLSLPLAYKNFQKHLRKTGVIITLFAGFVAVVPIAIKSYDNLMSRTAKEAESGSYGSGRSEFYPVALESYQSGTDMQLLFGRSIEDLKDQIERKLGLRITSHNGWIDMLYEYGFCGLLIYVSVFVSLYKRSKYIRRFTPEYYYLYLYMIVALLIKNTVTHGNIPDAYTIVWAYILYKSNQRQRLNCKLR